MRLLLIRHGETVDNVAGVYAGVTDSPLTNHGVLQASRLGAHLASTNIVCAHIFSSDLQRAAKTAEAIRRAQANESLTITQLQVLREQDFGSYEGKRFSERQGSIVSRDRAINPEPQVDAQVGFREVESKAAMKVRAETFLNDHIFPLIPFVTDEEAIVVVAHGIILNHLWRGILGRFDSGSVAISPGVTIGRPGIGLEYLGTWSNTGCLDLRILMKNDSAWAPPPEEILSSPQAKPIEGDVSSSPPSCEMPPSHRPVKDTSVLSPSSDASRSVGSSILAPHQPMNLLVKAVNCQDHLKGLKKTRGGIGSLKYDEAQKPIDSFFKKQKLN